jgi:hypothetical protein
VRISNCILIVEGGSVVPCSWNWWLRLQIRVKAWQRWYVQRTVKALSRTRYLLWPWRMRMSLHHERRTHCVEKIQIDGDDFLTHVLVDVADVLPPPYKAQSSKDYNDSLWESVETTVRHFWTNLRTWSDTQSSMKMEFNLNGTIKVQNVAPPFVENSR